MTTNAQPPDTLWTSTLGTDDWDECESAQLTSDGGFILGGRTSVPFLNQQLYAIKTDENGLFEWEQILGGNYLDYCYSIIELSDGNYLAGGEENSSTGGLFQIYLVKFNSAGVIIWEQSIGSPNGDDVCESIVETSDGGYILGGWTSSYGAGAIDCYLVKTDTSGAVIWENTYGGEGYEWVESVDVTDDGGFILGGRMGSFGAAVYDMFALKTDSVGIQQWLYLYGGDQDDGCNSIQQTTDGGYILGGTTNLSSQGQEDMYLVKIDNMGNVEWEQTFGGGNYEDCKAVEQTSDGGYIFAGTTASYGLGNEDIFVVKTDADGLLEWQQAYGDVDWNEGTAVHEIETGGYILAGTRAFGDMYLIRLEDGGTTPQIEISLTPENPPIIIPDSGGSFNFDINASNSYQTHLIFDVWIMVSLPNGSQFGPVLGPANLTLSGENSIERNRTQLVPPSAPQGEYLYEAYAGVYPDYIWGSDSFAFEKLGSLESYQADEWNNFEAVTSGELHETEYEPIIEMTVLKAYPNPFNPTTAISYQLSAFSHVNLSVYDVSGRKVASLVDGYRDAGAHEVIFDGTGLASGVYLYQLEVSGSGATPTMEAIVGKMVLIK